MVAAPIYLVQRALNMFLARRFFYLQGTLPYRMEGFDNGVRGESIAVEECLPSPLPKLLNHPEIRIEDSTQLSIRSGAQVAAG